VSSARLLLLILSAALLAAPFLEPLFFPLAWIAFVPLFWTIGHAKSLREAVFYGWAMGFVAHLIGFHWLVYTISAFGEFPYAVSMVVFICYAALQAIQMAIFGLLLRIAGFGPLQIFPAVFWIALEFLFPLLFPWHVADSQVLFSRFIQSADLVGPYGASFIILWVNGAVYKAAFATNEKPSAKWLPIAYSGLSMIISVFYGFQRLESVTDEMAGARKLSVAAVQGNVDIDLKWNPLRAKSNLDKHIKLTNQLDAASLVIWPESAIEEWIPEGLKQLPMDYMPAFKSERSFFIFGAKSFQGKPGLPGFKAFNTAFFTDAQGKMLSRYHKQVLLAFGEYLPFSRILAQLPMMPFADSFTPGPGPVVFHLPRGVRIAPLVCYEDLMPDLSRKFVSETRANLLVNLTNDAWYGKSVGPWQHLRLAQSRAIETRRTLLRVTNTGVTSLIDARGELVKSLPMFSEAVMPIDVDILTGETYYVRFGDWFAWGMTAISIGLLLFHFKRGLRKE
jgi:apolipoprotein N-acyltransferase